ncbi:MAG: hypothetical protein CBD98_001565 [Flavobacteriaceae bacterium TMED238]|nr:hypothetical protein [Flavobacteriales bacterium]RPG62931.1 MAG: hypothetical protein CBD98_001565 [Flavobacteriaceae bacterium TMED238]|tara:strand:- start:1725 stop:2216 length:492 start_codon:yes stop_codon:yes gene_type:complete
MKISKIYFVTAIIVVAVLSRLVPHPPNFTPITAVALFSIINFKNKYLGLSIPIICLFISDLILGISLINFFVYFSFILISVVGYLLKKINITSILASSLIFFTVTNFGVWLIGYPNTIEGFIACYVAALPFFGWTIAGDLFYSYSAKFSLNFFERKYVSNLSN